MERKTRRVVFADRKLEEGYKRLATAMHPEDRRTYLVLQDIRRQLHTKYLTGSKIPENKIPDVYRRLFQVSNLWSLDFAPHGRVLYSLVEDEIRIVDLV